MAESLLSNPAPVDSTGVSSAARYALPAIVVAILLSSIRECGKIVIKAKNKIRFVMLMTESKVPYKNIFRWVH